MGRKIKEIIINSFRGYKDETIFNLGGGFTELERVNPPKIDDIVTFKYYGFTKNKKPKFASFLRIRKNE
jgi:DNA ligase-1